MNDTTKPCREAKWYGVSHGDGNDGVSHIFADYYVLTDEPYRLVELAALTSFNPEYVKWAKENMDVEGDHEFVVSATFFEMPETQEARQELCDAAQAARDVGDEYGADELDEEVDTFGRDYAELIFEVFPCEPDQQREGCPTYGSLAECFGDDCALVEPEGE